MNVVLETVSNIVKDMKYNNRKNSIGIYFNNKEDMNNMVKCFKQYLKDNNFIYIKTNEDYFYMNMKCRLSFILIDGYKIAYKFSHIIYESNTKENIVKYVISTSFAGNNAKDFIPLDYNEV